MANFGPPADLIDSLARLRLERPTAHPFTLCLALDPDGRRCSTITGSRVKAWLQHPAVAARLAELRCGPVPVE